MKHKPGHFKNLLKEQMRRSRLTKNSNNSKRIPDPGLPVLPPEFRSQKTIERYLKTRIKSKEDFIIMYNNVFMPYASYMDIPSAEEILSDIPLNEDNNQELMTEWFWHAAWTLAKIAYKMYQLANQLHNFCCAQGWVCCDGEG